MALGSKHVVLGVGLVAGLGVAGSAAVRPQPVALAQSSAVRLPHLSGTGHFVDELDVQSFQRGNIHTHSSRSDGDRPPEDVYRWYRDHGYNFVALTDHNQLTHPDEFKSFEKKGFTLIPGEEVTIYVGKVPVHVNGICTKHAIGNSKFDDVPTALAWAVGQVRAQGAVALINHPNFEWALKAKDLAAGRGAQLLEIWSGHPYVHPEGDETRPSEETIWEQALTAGETFAPAAVDDSHHYKPEDKEPAARPGRGWVYAFGSETKRGPICDALRAGRLYASNGGAFERIALGRAELAVWPAGEGTTIEFLGAGGALLATEHPAAGAKASYAPKGGEGFVRVRLTRGDGKRAWTRAYRVETEIHAER
jgi:hypothetical protein